MSRKSKTYSDFLGDSRQKDKLWCETCQRWIPLSYKDKDGQPCYIHTCYDAKAMDQKGGK